VIFNKVGLRKVICTVIVALFVSQNVFAQDNQTSTKAGPKKQLTVIFLAGLGGAVFGLSTLSFYGRPQAHLKNIAGGFALGIIVGTIYMTYNTASKPKEYLSGELDPAPMDMHFTSRDSLDTKLGPQLLSYNFSF
jgi:hypothetical protein